jgi:predicted secreted acid phosphatase
VRAELLCLLLATVSFGTDAAEPVNIAQLKKELKAYHTEQYTADLASKLREARDWIIKQAPKVKKAALVLDIDETLLSNWDEIVANDFAFVATGPCPAPPTLPCGNLAWDQSTRATAIEPTLDLYVEVKKIGVAVFFITGRVEDPLERAATELNLWKVGYQGWTKLYMRAAHDSGTVAEYKTNARKDIENLGFTIVANVGDQESDLVGDHAQKTFKLPNPFYLIPVE